MNIGTVYRLESGRSFVSLANSVSARYEARSGENEIAFANLSLSAGHQLSRLSLALSDSFLRDDDPGRASPSGIRRGRRTFLRNRVSPQMRYAFSRRTSIDLAYTNTLVESTGDLGRDDSLSHAITADLQHRLSRSLTTNISYTFTTDDSEAAADTQAHSATAELGYVLTRRTNISLRAFGSVTDRRGGGTDSRTYGGSVGVYRQLTSFLSAFVSLGATVLERENENDKVFINWQVNLDGALPVFLTRRTILTLTSQQSVDDTVGEVDNVGVVLNQAVSLSLSHTASRYLRALLFVNFSRTELLESAIGTMESIRGRVDNFWRAGARVSYALTRVLSLSVAYLYQRRSSNLAGSDFDENRVTLALSGSFSVL
jgi:hypothetical protein